MTAASRDGACADGEFAINLVMPYIRQRFRLPELSLPVLNGETEGETPSVTAAFTRDFWGLGYGPINNMVHLVESKGVTVFWLSEVSDKVDAFSLWFDGHPYIFLNTTHVDGERERFTVAHELGHLIMHRNEVYSSGHGPNWSDYEREANEFASSFLLPYSEFRVECPRYPVLSEFLPLKHRWKVSIQAMIRRGRDMGLFSESQYKQANIEISRRHWRRAEPESMPRESSQLHQIIFDRLATKGVSVQHMAGELHVLPSDIGTVSPYAHELLRVGGRPAQWSKQEPPDAHVLPFRLAK
jgi:Zn-dependent peptidase ImmA (M78 family)